MSYIIREMRLDELEQARVFAMQCELDVAAECEWIHHLSLMAYEAQTLVGLAAAIRCDKSGVVYKLVATDGQNHTSETVESDMLDKIMVKTHAIHNHRLRFSAVEAETMARPWALDDWSPDPQTQGSIHRET